MISLIDYAVGFGGKFGVQKDRQDKSAVGYDHSEEIPKHHSQTDHKKVKYSLYSNCMRRALLSTV